MSPLNKMKDLKSPRTSQYFSYPNNKPTVFPTRDPEHHHDDEHGSHGHGSHGHGSHGHGSHGHGSHGHG
eukprot:UN22808